MKTNIIFKLADKFIYKLQKHAQSSEVDNSSVILAVRPTVNSILTKINFNSLISKTLQDVVNKISEANQEIHGDIKIDIFVTNATGGIGKWRIDHATSGLKFTGSLVNDKTVGPVFKQLISKANSLIFPSLEKEFNRISQVDKQGWAGDKITNHETNINEVNLNV